MPVKRWGPGWALQRGPPGSKAGVREPRSEAQGPYEWSAAALVTLAADGELRPIYGHPIFCNTVHQMEWMACFNLSGVYWARIPRHDEHSHLAILTK